MADLGNVSRADKVVITRFALGITPAAWPNVSRAGRVVPTVAFASVRGQIKQGTGVDIDIPASGIVSLLQGGQLVDVERGVGGHTHFYDLDDGVYYAHAADGTATWRVTVTGSTVFIEDLLGGAMATRRPLVRVSGKTKQLPAGDVLPGNFLRVLFAGGVTKYVPLNDNGELPIQLASGAPDAIPVPNGW